MYEVKNDSDRGVFAQAIPSYGPQVAGRLRQENGVLLLYASGVEAQRDAADARGIRSRGGTSRRCAYDTLSYTFFRVEGAGAKPG